jgi:hypothetical protein
MCDIIQAQVMLQQMHSVNKGQATLKWMGMVVLGQ